MKITLCGPAAAGKGTLARALARELNIVHIDAGLIFRSIAYGISSKLITFPTEIDLTVNNGSWRYAWDGNSSSVLYDDVRINQILEQEEIASRTAQYAGNPKYLKAMIEVVEKLCQELTSVVLDGRNAGTTLLPVADIKFYIDASIDVRVRRRYRQALENGSSVSFSKILDGLKIRDHFDKKRKYEPLRIPEQAHVLDTTNLTQDQALEHMLKIIAAFDACDAY